jgi:hypothetical protein
MSPVTTPLRRKLALAAGLLCLAVPVLSSCGFDHATDRPNVLANGGYDIGKTGMRVLAARIVATQDGQGTFVATIALNPTADPITDASDAPTLEQISTGPNSQYQLSAKKFTPVAVSDTGAVNMADPSVGGVTVTGDFKAGSIVPVKLTFSDGSSVVVQTPVVAKCGDYASVAPQSGSGKNSSAASQSSSASESSSASGSSAYDCSYPTLPPIPGA